MDPYIGLRVTVLLYMLGVKVDNRQEKDKNMTAINNGGRNA
jgi:hypothetical protein